MTSSNLHVAAEWAELVGDQGLRLLHDSGQTVHAGLEQFPTALADCGASRVLAVVDRRALQAAGLDAMFEEAVQGLAVECFTDFSPNPTAEQATAAAIAARRLEADCVVAIGGGSCLDVAKLAAIASCQPGDPDIAGVNRLPHDASGAPLIAAPTTSGSGSEATHFAVAYTDGVKTSFVHPALRPRHVLLDERFAQAMPAGLAAASGLDALAQSLESRWAVGGSEVSAEYARAAAQLIAESLVDSVTRGDRAARVRVMLGAFLAGQAINHSKTTAAHAMSYQLTSRYQIPHGHAVALILGWIGAANALTGPDDSGDPRGAEHTRRSVNEAAAWLGVEPAGLPEKVAKLLAAVGLAASLREAGVPAEDLPSLAEAVDPTRLGNNPRRFALEQLHAIYSQAWQGITDDADGLRG